MRRNRNSTFREKQARYPALTNLSAFSTNSSVPMKILAQVTQNQGAAPGTGAKGKGPLIGGPFWSYFRVEQHPAGGQR
jgi:hypothetical protein